MGTRLGYLFIFLALLVGAIHGAQLDIDCDFESGTLCQWKPGVDDTVHFQVGTHTNVSSQLPAPFFAPPTDHTRGGSPSGHFAYIIYVSDKEGPWDKTQVSASLSAPNPYPQQVVCFEFSYFFYTVGPASNVLLTANTEHDDQIQYSAFSVNEERWHHARRTIVSNNSVTDFTLQAHIWRGLVAFDDIQIRPGACNATQPEDLVQLCTFEDNSFCNFGASILNKEWALDQGINRQADHTTNTQTGHYLSSYPIRNLYAELVSKPLVDGNIYRCFGFSYTSPSTVAKFYIDVHYQTHPDGQNHTIHWENTGLTEYGFWQNQRISLPKMANLNLILGVERASTSSENFVDDILLDTAECVAPYDCDFEQGTACSLECLQPSYDVQYYKKASLISIPKNSQTTIKELHYADSMWHVFEPSMSLDNFAPSDHTTRTHAGKYLLLVGDQGTEDERRNKGRAVIMTSRIYLPGFPSGHVCLRMAVFKPTYMNTVLEVYQSESSSPTFATKVFELSTNQFADHWIPVEIVGKVHNRSSTSIYFYIVGTIQLNGTIDRNSYIAIDDISVSADCSQEPATELPTQAPTHPTELKNQTPAATTEPTHDWNRTTLAPHEDCFFYGSCTGVNGSRICLNWDLMCNFINDCEDGRDEAQCGDCNFDNGTMCGWESEFWTVIQPAWNSSRDMPKVDADGNSDGGYATVGLGWENFGPEFAAIGIMKSFPPLSSETSAECKLHFAYHSKNGASLIFRRIIYGHGSLQPHTLLNMTSSTGAQNVWNSYTVEVGHQKAGYNFEFIAQAKNLNGVDEDVAIDNVKFVDCSPYKH